MSKAILTKAKQVRSNVTFTVYQQIEEMRKEIEREFAEVLKSNPISPYSEGVVLFGDNFAFKYVGVTRFKNVIHLKFEVYRRHEINHQHEKYDHSIGKVVVAVRVK